MRIKPVSIEYKLSRRAANLTDEDAIMDVEDYYIAKTEAYFEGSISSWSCEFKDNTILFYDLEWEE